MKADLKFPRYRPVSALLTCLAALFALAGCTPILESSQPATSTWWLEPTQVDRASIAGEPRPLALSVAVVPGLDSDRILTLDPDARLDHIAGAHWADHLPELVTSLVTRSLEGAPRFPVISRHDYRRDGECRLSLEVRQFQVMLDAGNISRSVAVDIAGLYHCDDKRQVLALSATAPVTANRLPEIVRAFQTAVDDSMRQLATVLADP